MKHEAKQNKLVHDMRCLSLGYCEYQDIFRYLDANAYTCGLYGWNADVYEVGGNFAIVTGYRPFGKVRLRIRNDALKEIADLAEEYTRSSMGQEEFKGKIKDVLRNECYNCWEGAKE